MITIPIVVFPVNNWIYSTNIGTLLIFGTSLLIEFKYGENISRAFSARFWCILINVLERLAYSIAKILEMIITAGRPMALMIFSFSMSENAKENEMMLNPMTKFVIVSRCCSSWAILSYWSWWYILKSSFSMDDMFSFESVIVIFQESFSE